MHYYVGQRGRQGQNSECLLTPVNSGTTWADAPNLDNTWVVAIVLDIVVALQRAPETISSPSRVLELVSDIRYSVSDLQDVIEDPWRRVAIEPVARDAQAAGLGLRKRYPLAAAHSPVNADHDGRSAALSRSDERLGNCTIVVAALAKLRGSDPNFVLFSLLVCSFGPDDVVNIRNWFVRCIDTSSGAIRGAKLLIDVSHVHIFAANLWIQSGGVDVGEGGVRHIVHSGGSCDKVVAAYEGKSRGKRLKSYSLAG